MSQDESNGTDIPLCWMRGFAIVTGGQCSASRRSTREYVNSETSDGIRCLPSRNCELPIRISSGVRI
jgi:hypothetical protein